MSSTDAELRDLVEFPLAGEDENMIPSQIHGPFASGTEGIRATTVEEGKVLDLKPQGPLSAASEPLTIRKAYVTIVTDKCNDDMLGVKGLIKGLKKAKSKYPLVVMVLPDVSEAYRSHLALLGCIVKDIKPLSGASHVTNYLKVRIWELVEYDKVIYLDPHVQVFENIDYMFDYPGSYFYAALDCCCEESRSHNQQHKIRYCQQWPNKVQWDPTLGPEPPLYFNASMFVLEPSLEIYRHLVKTLEASPITALAEQDLLNEYYKDNFVALASHYNLQVPMLWHHSEAVELDKVKVVNYCANGSKPWSYTGKEENMEREDVKMLVNKWWEIDNDYALDYKKGVTSAEAGKGTDQVNLQPVTSAEAGKGTDQVNLGPSKASLSENGAVKFISAPSTA